jgi:hypothetical protein
MGAWWKCVAIGYEDWVVVQFENAEGVGEFQPIYEAVSAVKRFLGTL